MSANNKSNTNSTNNSLMENNNIESSFYEDSNPQSVSTSSANSMKRPISLDLNSSKNPNKKQRIQLPTPLALPSPDFQGMKFNTPDLENIILANEGLLQTPKFPELASGPPQLPAVPPQQTKSSIEREDFAKGFHEALDNLHKHKGMSGGSITYTNLDDSFPVAVKDEPQTVTSSPPVSPIDMETQEKIKLERKRQRNRLAASKCRKRKLERISKLEDKVKNMKGENTELASVIKQLKEHVFQLKQQVIDHINAGCNISLYNSASILQSK